MKRSNLSGPLVVGLALLAAPAAWAFPPVITVSHESACPPSAPGPSCCTHALAGPTKVKFKKSCPCPMCDPCSLPDFGFHKTTWMAWPRHDAGGHLFIPPLPPAGGPSAEPETPAAPKAEAPKFPLLGEPKPLPDEETVTPWRTFPR